MALNNLALRLRELGRRHEALVAAEEAVSAGAALPGAAGSPWFMDDDNGAELSDSVRGGGGQPDPKLLGPITEVLQQLQKSPERDQG